MQTIQVLLKGMVAQSSGIAVTAGGIAVTAGGIAMTADGIAVTAGGIAVTAGGHHILHWSLGYPLCYMYLGLGFESLVAY